MKKTLALILALTLMILVLPLNVFAEETVITLTPEYSDELSVGDTFLVTAELTGNTGFASLGLTLVWNSEVVKFNGFVTEYNDLVGADVLTDSIVATANAVNTTGKIGFSKATDVTKNGKLFIAEFEVIAAGTCYITLDQSSPVTFEFKNAAQETISVNVVDTTTMNLTVTASGNETPEEPELPTDKTFTADLDCNLENAKVGDTVTVDVLVGGTTGEFASSELELTYTGLTYDSANSTTNGADITAAGGTIKIIDHGETTTWTEGTVTAYTLKFTVDAIDGATGTAKVTLNSAALSTAANAKEYDLTPATITVAEKTFEVTPADLTVTLPDGFTSTSDSNSVVYGEDFTFKADNVHYTYDLSAAPYEIVKNQDGTWTIENVTSNVTITENVNNRVPKKYVIKFNTLDHIKTVDGIDSATFEIEVAYGTAFSFVLKDDVDASTESGVKYTVDSIVYEASGNVEFTAPTTETNRTYTISGANITGNIVITTSAETVDPDQFTVTLPTEYGNELSVDKTVVDANGSVELTLTPEAGYKYTIKYTMGNNAEVTLVEGANDNETYTISDITANVTVKVEKSVDTGSINLVVQNSYLALNGKTMHMVMITNANLTSGKIYTYNNENMFYSKMYNGGAGAYVYLVITDANETLTADTARANISIAQGSATSIDYTGDVNKTKKVDVNDAQLVWNIYSDKLYSNFDALSMEKFLRADVEGDGDIDTDDAALIIAAIKNRQE